MPGPIRIPNVVIEMPGLTSRFLYEPLYVVPLVERFLDNAALPQDRRIRVRGINPANEMEAHLSHTVLDPAKSEGVESEYDRLRERYAARTKLQGGAPVFDLIYPGTSFAEAFEKARRGSGLPAPRVTETPRDLHPLRVGKPATGELLGVKGMTPAAADALAAIGIATMDELANARVVELMALPDIGDSAGTLIQNAAIALRVVGREDQAAQTTQAEAVTGPDLFDEDAATARPLVALP